jgi:toxin HigB-1
VVESRPAKAMKCRNEQLSDGRGAVLKDRRPHHGVLLEELNVPPGNRLEALKGGRRGQHSIRISDQWRICFRWEIDGVYDVEIVDYH